MKYTYERAIRYLQHIFRLIDTAYFNNSLIMPTITIQQSVGAYGHITVDKVWHSNISDTHELNISAEYLSRPIVNLVATLIHEAVHLYALQNNIKDTSNRGVYHNRKFKELAEERGLIISKHKQYGWTITSPSNELYEFCKNNNLSDIQLVRRTTTNIPDNDDAKPTSKPKNLKPTSTRKYMCRCGNSFRATKELNVICVVCKQMYEKV